MGECICGHYHQNHEYNNHKYSGKCKGQIGCAGHEKCYCKGYKSRSVIKNE